MEHWLLPWKLLPTDPSVIVTVSPIEIVSVTVEDSPPPLEVVNKSVAMLEDRESELEITVVVLIVMVEGRRLELEATEGPFGNVDLSRIYAIPNGHWLFVATDPGTKSCALYRSSDMICSEAGDSRSS